MTDSEAREAQKALVDFGMCETMDEAAHFLVDAGEIDSTQHAELLSEIESERIYG
jgi:acyl carrier protein